MILIIGLVGLIGFLSGFLLAVLVLPSEPDDSYYACVSDLADLRSDQIGSLIAAGDPDQVLRLFEDRAKRILSLRK